MLFILIYRIYGGEYRHSTQGNYASVRVKPIQEYGSTYDDGETVKNGIQEFDSKGSSIDSNSPHQYDEDQEEPELPPAKTHRAKKDSSIFGKLFTYLFYEDDHHESNSLNNDSNYNTISTTNTKHSHHDDLNPWKEHSGTSNNENYHGFPVMINGYKHRDDLDPWKVPRVITNDPILEPTVLSVSSSSVEKDQLVQNIDRDQQTARIVRTQNSDFLMSQSHQDQTKSQHNDDVDLDHEASFVNNERLTVNILHHDNLNQTEANLLDNEQSTVKPISDTQHRKGDIRPENPHAFEEDQSAQKSKYDPPVEKRTNDSPTPKFLEKDSSANQSLLDYFWDLNKKNAHSDHTVSTFLEKGRTNTPPGSETFKDVSMDPHTNTSHPLAVKDKEQNVTFLGQNIPYDIPSLENQDLKIYHPGQDDISNSSVRQDSANTEVDDLHPLERQSLTGVDASQTVSADVPFHTLLHKNEKRGTHGIAFLQEKKDFVDSHRRPGRKNLRDPQEQKHEAIQKHLGFKQTADKSLRGKGYKTYMSSRQYGDGDKEIHSSLMYGSHHKASSQSYNKNNVGSSELYRRSNTISILPPVIEEGGIEEHTSQNNSNTIPVLPTVIEGDIVYEQKLQDRTNIDRANPLVESIRRDGTEATKGSHDIVTELTITPSRTAEVLQSRTTNTPQIQQEKESQNTGMIPVMASSPAVELLRSQIINTSHSEQDQLPMTQQKDYETSRGEGKGEMVSQEEIILPISTKNTWTFFGWIRNAMGKQITEEMLPQEETVTPISTTDTSLISTTDTWTFFDSVLSLLSMKTEDTQSSQDSRSTDKIPLYPDCDSIPGYVKDFDNRECISHVNIIYHNVMILLLIGIMYIIYLCYRSNKIMRRKRLSKMKVDPAGGYDFSKARPLLKDLNSRRRSSLPSTIYRVG